MSPHCWRTNHWDCAVGDALIGKPDEHTYFNPPIPPTGGPILTVTAFYAPVIPRAGWVFVREALGKRWVRQS